MIARLCRRHPRTACPTPHGERSQSIAGSGPIDVEGSFRCTSSARMAGSSRNLWRTTFSTAAKKMLNSSGDNTHPCRSPYSTSNQSGQASSLGRTQALIPSWNCRMTAIICGGTPMRVSTCHRRVRSTVICYFVVVLASPFPLKPVCIIHFSVGQYPFCFSFWCSTGV